MITEKLNAGMSLMDVDTAELLKTDAPALALLNAEEQVTKSSLLDTVQSSLAQDLVDFPEDIPLSGNSSAEDTISADETLPNSQTTVEDITSDLISSDQPVPSSEHVLQDSSEKPAKENDRIAHNTEPSKEDHPKCETLDEFEIVDMGGMDVVEEVLDSEDRSVGVEATLAAEVKENVVENVSDIEIKDVENVLIPELKHSEVLIEKATDSESNPDVEGSTASTAKIESKSDEANS